MSKKRLYETLGVSPEASEQQIRKAYRELARKHHPDRNPGNKQAEDRFKEASYASEILLNKKKRGLYDEFGEVGLRDGFDPDAYRAFAERQGQRGGAGGGFGGLEDLFEQARRRGGSAAAGSVEDLLGSEVLDGLFGGRRGKRRRPAPELVSDLTVDLMEVARGGERELTLTGPSGETRSLKVRIPAGAREGGQIRLRGQADGGADLVLRIHVKEHPDFKLEGDDLLLEMPVSVGEAFHGGQVDVPTPDGRVKLRIPKGVRGGSRLRLKGKGVRRGESTGDLLVQIHIVLPEAPEAGELVDKLEGLYPPGGARVPR